MFGMSFYIISGTKKSDINLLNCDLEQFNAVEAMEISRLIYMHIIVYYQSNMTCLTVLIMNLHIHKCPTF